MGGVFFSGEKNCEIQNMHAVLRPTVLNVMEIPPLPEQTITAAHAHYFGVEDLSGHISGCEEFNIRSRALHWRNRRVKSLPERG